MSNDQTQSTLELNRNTSPRDVIDWLAERGHRGAYGGDIAGTERAAVIMFDRGPNTRLQMAMPGDMLTVNPDGSISVTTASTGGAGA
jgi:hypothetical protein